MCFGVGLERGERLQVTRVGELVEVHDRLVALRDPVEYEIGADEARAAGYQDHEVPCCGETIALWRINR
jgi:hypothetical protein